MAGVAGALALLGRRAGRVLQPEAIYCAWHAGLHAHAGGAHAAGLGGPVRRTAALHPQQWQPALRSQRPYGAAAAPQAQPELETYQVSVVTGNVRGASTGSAAYVQLIGTNGRSEKVVVGDSEDDGLERGSTVTFDLPVPVGMGAIRRLHVERGRASATDTGDGWYLDHIEVRGPRGEHYTFPCHSWFGHSDCGDYDGAVAVCLLRGGGGLWAVETDGVQRAVRRRAAPSSLCRFLLMKHTHNTIPDTQKT